jgi:hypothetical protein
MTQSLHEEGEALLHIGKLTNANSWVMSIAGGESGDSVKCFMLFH